LIYDFIKLLILNTTGTFNYHFIIKKQERIFKNKYWKSGKFSTFAKIFSDGI